MRLNEAGLDYRVAFARAADGADWVLRMPRRRLPGEPGLTLDANGQAEWHFDPSSTGQPPRWATRIDFTYQHMMGPAAFDATVQAYLAVRTLDIVATQSYLTF